MKGNHGALKNLCKNVLSYENFKGLNKYQKNTVNFRKINIKDIPIQFLINLSKLSLPVHVIRDLSYMNHVSFDIFTQLISSLNGGKINAQIVAKNNGDFFINLLINGINIFSYYIQKIFLKNIKIEKSIIEDININIDCNIIYHFKDDRLEIFNINVKDKDFQNLQFHTIMIPSYNLFRFRFRFTFCYLNCAKLTFFCNISCFS